MERDRANGVTERRKRPSECRDRAKRETERKERQSEWRETEAQEKASEAACTCGRVLRASGRGGRRRLEPGWRWWPEQAEASGGGKQSSHGVGAAPACNSIPRLLGAGAQRSSSAATTARRCRVRACEGEGRVCARGGPRRRRRRRAGGRAAGHLPPSPFSPPHPSPPSFLLSRLEPWGSGGRGGRATGHRLALRAQKCGSAWRGDGPPPGQTPLGMAMVHPLLGSTGHGHGLYPLEKRLAWPWSCGSAWPGHSPPPRIRRFVAMVQPLGAHGKAPGEGRKGDRFDGLRRPKQTARRLAAMLLRPAAGPSCPPASRHFSIRFPSFD